MPRKKGAGASASEPAAGGAEEVRGALKRSLLDEEEEGGAAAPAFTVNEAYAKRFQHNKEREDLHRLQAKHGPAVAARLAARAKRGDSEEEDDEDESPSESASDSEEAAAVETALDDRFLETLLKIRRRDPSIYQAGAAQLLGGDGGGDRAAPAQAVVPAPAKKKALYLRDVQAQQLLARAAGEEEGSSSDEEGGAALRSSRALGAPRGATYAQEQEAARRAFLAAVPDSDGEAEAEEGEGGEGDAAAGLLRKKRGQPRHVDALPPRAQQQQQLLSTVFAAAPAPDGDAGADAFLQDYLGNRRWLQDGPGGDAAGESSESEEELARGEAFEATYNFRFEEPNAQALAAQPRRPEGVIRKQGSARADARHAKAERVAADKARLRDELKRLKNLKKKDIEAKVAAIRAVAGSSTLALGCEVLDDDAEWDEAAHERLMSAAFGDGYYGQPEADEQELVKPRFGDMDAELRSLLSSDAAGEGGFAAVQRAARAPPSQSDSDHSDDDEDEEEEEEAAAAAGGEGEGEEGSRFSKRAMKKWRRQLASQLEEYYALDCEDFVAGLPCRFRYKAVAPDKYGLRTEEILTLSDKELNQVVSLKKLAPYREQEARPAYGSKRERAEAALSKMHRGEGAVKRKRSAGAAGEEAAAEAAQRARAASFTAPTKRARKEAQERELELQKAQAPSKNAAKRMRKKRSKEAKKAGGTGVDE